MTALALEPHPLGPGARAYFTSSPGGTSKGLWSAERRQAGLGPGLNLGGAVGDDPQAVATNRQLLDVAVGAPVVWMRQVHSATVRQVDTPDAELGECDITIHRGAEPLALAVLTADCTPLLLASRDGATTVAAHVGRPGLMAGAAAAAIAAITQHHPPDDVFAAIGPTICGTCYEVPDDLAKAVWVAHPATRATTRWGSAGIDLAKGVAAELKRAGITLTGPKPRCTYEHADLYSYRWATHDGEGKCGRIASVVVSSRVSEPSRTPRLG